MALRLNPPPLLWKVHVHSSKNVTDLSGSVVTNPLELGWYDARRHATNAADVSDAPTLILSQDSTERLSYNFLMDTTAAYVCLLTIHQSTVVQQAVHYKGTGVSLLRHPVDKGSSTM